MKPLGKTPHICLITEGKATPQNFPAQSSYIIETIRAAIEDGVTMIQIREKAIEGRMLFDLVSRAIVLAANSDTLVIVNDRADVAAAAGADGVHLPETGLPPSAVKRVFPNLAVGVSTHSLDSAVAAAQGGGDFIFFGPVFDTPGKGAAVGVEPLAVLCQVLTPPVIGLGGIDDQNCASVLDAGAAGIAAIRALNDPGSRREIVRKLRPSR